MRKARHNISEHDAERERETLTAAMNGGVQNSVNGLAIR